MNKVITFSVAAYNVEQYIGNILNSFLKLDRNEEIEVLIINDGSSDKTAQIAQSYEKEYPDVFKLISKKNGGHGSTINTGIINASGKYFKAIDGDDWVDVSTAKVIDYLGKIDSDIIVTDYLECYSFSKKTVIYNNKLENEHIYQFDDICNKIPWIKYHSAIFKTDLVKNNFRPLDEHCFYVDSEYMLYYIAYVKTLVYIKQPVYCYRLGEEGQSVSESSRKKHINDAEKVGESMLNFFDLITSDISLSKKQYIEKGIANHIGWISWGYLFFSPSKHYKEKCKSLYFKIKQNYPEIFQLLVHENPRKFLKPSWENEFKWYTLFGLIRDVKKRHG